MVDLMTVRNLEGKRGMKDTGRHSNNYRLRLSRVDENGFAFEYWLRLCLAIKWVLKPGGIRAVFRGVEA